MRQFCKGLIFFLSISIWCTFVFAQGHSQGAIRIAVLDSGQHNPHERLVLNLFKKSLKGCKVCLVEPFPIYNAKGELFEGQFLKALHRAEKRATIIHLSWNMKKSKKFEAVERKLKALIKKGVLIVGAAGESDRRPLPLSQTVLGSIDGIYLIGEIGKKGVLKLSSHFGEQLFTALPKVKKHAGSSFTAVLFTANLAKALSKFPRDQVLKRLEGKRSRGKFPYPSLKDLFDPLL